MLYSNMTIDIAEVSDAQEIARFSRDFIEYDLGWEYTPGKIQQLIRHPAKNVVVARDGSQPIGFGIMSYAEETANLDLLGVRLRYRYQGAGRQILTWLELVAVTAGIASIYVQVRQINTGAIKFYQRLGYATQREIHGYYRGKEHAVLMCKRLRR